MRMVSACLTFLAVERRGRDPDAPHPQGLRPGAGGRAMLDELFELACWAPNHNLTNPWRFRVVGPGRSALKEAPGPESAPKLDRAPTLVVRAGRADRRPGAGRGGPSAPRVAIYIVLLGRARARAGRLLAHAGGAARAPPAARRSARTRRARARPDPPRKRVRRRRRRRARLRRVRNVSGVIPAKTRSPRSRPTLRPRGDRRRHHRRGRRARRRTRGYSVALVEREDWSAGTSSRSSKLVHGGLRYLQNFDLGLVREALLERADDGEPRAAPRPPAAVARAELRRQAPGPDDRRRAEHVRRHGQRLKRPAARRASRRRGVEPGASPDDRRRRGARAAARARRARARARPISSTTARPTTRGSC